MTSSVLSEQTDTETLVVYSPLQPLLLRSSPLPQQTSPFFSPSSRLFPLSFFFSVTKSPAHQAAKTAAGPERLLQSGQLHLSWINDLSRCFANSSKCVIVTVIICENTE